MAREFSLGEGDENVGSKNDSFKPAAGKYRFSVIGYKDLDPTTGCPLDSKGLPVGKPDFRSANQIYAPGVGAIQVPEDADGNADPRFAEYDQNKKIAEKVGMVIAVWPVDSEGGIANYTKAAKGAKILPFVFSSTDFSKTFRPCFPKDRKTNRALSPLVQDVMLDVANNKYKSRTFSAAQKDPDADEKVIEHSASMIQVMWHDEALRPLLLGLFKAADAKLKALDSVMGKNLTLSQLKEAVVAAAQRANGDQAAGPKTGAKAGVGGSVELDSDIDNMIQ